MSLAWVPGCGGGSSLRAASGTVKGRFPSRGGCPPRSNAPDVAPLSPGRPWTERRRAGPRPREGPSVFAEPLGAGRGGGAPGALAEVLKRIPPHDRDHRTQEFAPGTPERDRSVVRHERSRSARRRGNDQGERARPVTPRERPARVGLRRSRSGPRSSVEAISPIHPRPPSRGLIRLRRSSAGGRSGLAWKP